MSELVGFPAADIADWWPELGPRLESVATTSRGRYTLEDIRAKLEARDWQLWGALAGDHIAALGITCIVIYPSAKALHVVGVVGQGLETWLSLAPKLAEWGRSKGCTIMESRARPGWSRIMKGWDATHVFIERDI